MHTVKPVSLEMELDFHERLLNSVGKSIASTKKRLHDAELILNLRPPDHEEAEIQEWNVKVSQLIDRRGPLQFPTLSNIQREYEKKAFIKSIRSGRQKIESDEKFNQRMSRRLAKEAEMIKKKVLSDSASFGKKVTGSALRTIDGYDGLNTMYSGSRTLIRKEGAYVPQDPNKTSVPPWIGPQHYPDANKIPAFDKHDGQYRVPFKAAPRDATSEDVQKRQSESRRRRQINEQKQRLSLEESTIGTGSLTSFFTAFDSGANDLEHPVHTKSALEMAKEDKLGEDSVEFDLVLKEDEEDGGSLASSVTLYSRSRTNTSHHHHKKLTVGFLDESIEEVAAGEQSQVSTPRTPASSLFSQVRSKSILHSTRVRATAPVPKKQTRVPNPVYSRKDLTMKLLKLEERGNSNFFKVNDYTMNAFALHSPEVVYQEGFEAADVEAVPDESAGVYQNRSHGPFRKNKPIGPYTSDIFQVKPPEYVAHKPSAAVTTTDSAASVSGKISASPSTKMNRSASSRTALRLTPLSSTKSAKSIATAAIDRPLSRSKEKNTDVSSQDSPTPSSTYTPKLLRNDIETEKSRCERTINKIIQRRHDSRYYGDKKALIDEASIMSAEETEYHPSGQDLEDMHQSLTTRRSMEKWLDTHDIIRGPIGKRVEGASFLEAHKPLPSIALSLNGLLLENNPYSLEDEFMKDLFYKPASEIGL